jgi:hypothetical protein
MGRPRLTCLGLGGFLVLAALAGPAAADEPIFNYLYTTDLTPKGHFELEHWSTLGTGGARGDYNLLQNREEIEYGVTSAFQLALYLNSQYVDAARNNTDGTTGGPFVPANVNPNRRYAAYNFDTVSVEAIYRLLSPYIDPVGLALYVEPGYGPHHREVESKLLLHKNFLDDRLVTAVNVTFEWEWMQNTGNPNADPASLDFVPHWDHDLEVELGAGAAYRFAPGWFAGVEFRNNRDFSAHTLSKPEFSTYFLGPTLHYATQGWWTSFTVMPQLPVAAGYTADARANISDGRFYGNDHTALEIRLRAGLEF